MLAKSLCKILMCLYKWVLYKFSRVHRSASALRLFLCVFKSLVYVDSSDVGQSVYFSYGLYRDVRSWIVSVTRHIEEGMRNRENLKVVPSPLSLSLFLSFSLLLSLSFSLTLFLSRSLSASFEEKFATRPRITGRS